MWLAALSRGPLIEEIRAVWVQEIWRYPVKSMAGESLEAADLTEAGIVGDRVVQVRNAAGRIMTARTRPLLLRHRATLGSDNVVLVDGVPWTSADVARGRGGGSGCRNAPGPRQPGRPIRHPAASGRDRRNARGRWLRQTSLSAESGNRRCTGAFRTRMGTGADCVLVAVVIGMDDLRERCIMTTFDPDSGEQDLGVLRLVQKNSTAGWASIAM